MPPEIIVIGSASIDYNVLSDRLPAVGETVLGTQFWTNCGGKGANQAVAAARLGGRTGMLVRVGADEQGRTIASNLVENGVDGSLTRIDPTAPSGTAHIFVGGGKNQIVVVPGANGQLSALDVDQAQPLLRQARLVMLQLEIPVETAVYAIRSAHNLGLKVMLDPAPAFPLPNDLYPLIDYITPNESEAAVLTGLPVSDKESAILAGERLRQWGVRHPIMKLGDQGVVVWTGTVWQHVLAYHVPTIDSVAAGDAFSAGLAVALVEDKPLATAVRFGCACGGLATTRYGAMPSLPHRSAVDELQRQQA